MKYSPTRLPEGAGSVVLVLHAEVVTVNLCGALVHLVEVELLEDPPGQQQPGAVGGGVVGQTNLDAIPGELM